MFPIWIPIIQHIAHSKLPKTFGYLLRSQVVKDLLASMEGSRIHLEQFPAYAPELNPDEGVWNHLKRVELKNVNCQDLDGLYIELRKAKERLRHKTEVIKSFSRKTGLY